MTPGVDHAAYAPTVKQPAVFTHEDPPDSFDDDESLCPECEGDGGDKWNDYCLPCPTCGGDGRLW